MAAKYSVGGDVESWCTKCKLMLSHTISAMVEKLPKKVRCNTCNGLHNYRPKAPAKRKVSSKTTKRKSKANSFSPEEYQTQLEKLDLSTAKKYKIIGNFNEGEVIDHFKFGIGIVHSAIQKNKIDVFFKDGLKKLVQNHAL